jgi:uncharacterized repeat protein (TIGR03803 family)
MSCALAIAICQSAQAQTFSVIHAFTGGSDGYDPYAGVTIDRGGHLYGTTSEQAGEGGTVFEMKPVNGNWSFSTIFNFDITDGWIPFGRVVFGPGGSMFGTTWEGGNTQNCFEFGCGVVYNIRPPRTACNTSNCPWNGTAILSFDGEAGGGNPNLVDPVFDAAGNLYGTATTGGTSGIGVVFKLTRSDGVWTETVIHNFSGPDGALPYSGVIFDQAGNLYGTTGEGGQFDLGTVYRLSPSGSGWILTTLYSFRGTRDGERPAATLVFDGAGNLYGATMTGGSGGGGTVFRLSPSGGGWSFSVLYSFTGHVSNESYPGVYNALALDAAGNLYGADYADTPNGYGSIFKLALSNGSWTYSSLHDFTGGSDGANPIGGVNFDANGNLYGTTLGGGMQGGNCYTVGCGVVWKIAP